MKRKERRLPDNYTEAPASYKLGYTLNKSLRSHYGLGHFTEDFPYVWKRVGLYHDKWMPVDDYWIAPDGAMYRGRAGKILKPDPPIGSMVSRRFEVILRNGTPHRFIPIAIQILRRDVNYG